jgi:hypothetical protein
MIISILYLPKTAAKLPHQHVPSRSVCASQTNRPVMTATIR